MAAQKASAEARPLLCTRKQACALLGAGIGVHILVELEHAGKLHPIRLTGGPNSPIYYRHDEVLALVDDATEVATMGRTRRVRVRRQA